MFETPPPITEETEAALSTAYLAILSGLPPVAFEIKPGCQVVGRAPESDIRLDHGEVSRRHCEIKCEDGEYWVTDLESQWGTRVGTVAITERTALKPGDMLTLGEVQLVFEKGPLPTAEELKRRADAMAAAPVLVLFHGEPAASIPLGERTTIGRDPSSDVVLNSTAVSRHHAVVHGTPEGFTAADLKSSGGSFANGRKFDEHPLIIGDRLQFGPYCFVFDGRELRPVNSIAGGSIHAREANLEAKGRTVIENVSLDVAAGRFAGIIGPNAAGNTLLLEILMGRVASATGTVTVDGLPPSARAGLKSWAFVPRDEIVHPELTVSQALDFAMRLRFPHKAPALELQKLIRETMVQTGLAERGDTRVADLPKDQRKRASIAVQLLARPSVLFLDDPAAGLDTAAELKMFELLHDLAERGCTILCTSRLTESVQLMDQVTVVMAGHAIFSGKPQDVREFFGAGRFAELYDRLGQKTPTDWIRMAARTQLPAISPEAPGMPPVHGRVPWLARLAVLIERQCAILRQQKRNAILLAAQPILLGLLVGWVSANSSFRLFVAYIAALWFGCSNASQEIVADWPIYRTERAAGVDPALYVLGKLLVTGAVTVAQALLFYGVIQALGGLGGSVLWQIPALVLAALSGTAIGALVGAFARTLVRAFIAIPLIMAVFILLSGQTPATSELRTRPVISSIAGLMPSNAAQRCMDLSLVWRRPVDSVGSGAAYRNLVRVANTGSGQNFTDASPGWNGLFLLLFWTAAAGTGAGVALRLREEC